MNHNKKRFERPEDLTVFNEKITQPTVRVGSEILKFEDAFNKAKEDGVDLIVINDKVNPPICVMMELNKYLYEQKKKKREIEKNNRKNRVETKEIRLGVNTDDHDFNFKVKNSSEFLKDGDKVKISLMFKGREIQHKDKGELMLLRFADALKEFGKPEHLPKLEGKRMFMIISPKK
jgi:translation initiation factor IF-3